MPASRLRGTLQVLLWCCARRARCAITQTEMPVLSSVSACLSAMQNLSKKSLILLSDVEAESRKRQVLPAPRTPNAKRDHLSLMQGKETQRAWHRARGNALDGGASLSYPSPTTGATGVGASPHVSGNRLRRDGRSCGALAPAECHRTL